VQVRYVDQFHARTKNFYTVDGEPLPLRSVNVRGPEIAMPPTFTEMRRIAERLSDPFAFVRVDLYTLGKRIIVGELTHYPNAGHKPFDAEWEQRLAQLWKQARPDRSRFKMTPGRRAIAATSHLTCCLSCLLTGPMWRAGAAGRKEGVDRCPISSGIERRRSGRAGSTTTSADGRHCGSLRSRS
jgi:hypothetical protein